MKKNVFQMTMMLMTGLLVWSSCIKDEAPNMECDVQKVWVEGEEYAPNFTNASYMRKENITSTETEIKFTVRSLFSLPKQLPVHFELTPGATIEPANGSMQDFTNGPVTYTVTSEDGAYKRQYKVSFVEDILPSFKFKFENVRQEGSGSNIQYHVFFEKQGDQTLDIWSSGNKGASMRFIMESILSGKGATPEQFPTYSTDKGYEGKGVCMTTISAGSMGESVKKPIAAGNLFLGKFNSDVVLTKPLEATMFGIPIDREPYRVRGYYKYQPGEKFTNMEMKEVAGRTDEADIYAVFFKNQMAGGKEYLTGNDVADWEKLKADPNVIKVARVKQLPATNEWTRFEMFFEGKDASDQDVKDKKCNLALVFSSSKSGATFEGAIGSTLYIDEVEVSFDKTAEDK